MAEILVRELLESGAHFGHRVSRWNPRMAKYIYGTRNGVHVIDLRETVKGLIRGQRLLAHIAGTGAEILFVGTKRSAREAVAKHAARIGSPFVHERWLGGTLTNHTTILSRLARLEELEQMERDGRLKTYSKKMIATLQREKKRILRNLEGIRTMKKMPGAVVIVDPKHEVNAVNEAKRAKIPTVALVDSDSDPNWVDVCVPGNDDAVKVSDIFFRVMADAVADGKAQYAGAVGGPPEPPVAQAAQAQAQGMPAAR